MLNSLLDIEWKCITRRLVLKNRLHSQFRLISKSHSKCSYFQAFFLLPSIVCYLVVFCTRTSVNFNINLFYECAVTPVFSSSYLRRFFSEYFLYGFLWLF